jgi:hypothetical protein
MFKKILMAAMVAASFAGVTTVATARSVVITVAPPEVRQEAVPAPRRGYAWAPGHWEWRNSRHQWVSGTWIRERRGYTYEPARWEQDNGHWNMRHGRWNRTARDRDGDGVPNRMDRAPNNPNRN